MGSGASTISAESELSTFKEMQAKFEVLKTEGKTDEDIYAELKTLYNTSAGAGGGAPAAAPPASSNGDVENPAAAPDAATVAAPEAAPPAAKATVEVAAAPEPTEGEAVPAVTAETPAAETPAAATPAAAQEAPVEAAATAE